MKKQPILLLLCILLLLIGVNYLNAWTSPAFNPPSGNVEAPVNVSSNPQTKLGPLGVTELSTNNVAANDYMVVGAATASADLKIDANGKIGASEYCDADGNGCVTAGSLGGSEFAASYTTPAAPVDNVTYTAAVNTFVTAWSGGGSSCSIAGYVDGVMVSRAASSGSDTPSISFIVPASHTWKVDFNNNPACVTANQNIRYLEMGTL